MRTIKLLFCWEKTVLDKAKNRVSEAANELAQCNTGSIGETNRRAILKKEMAFLNIELVSALSSKIGDLSDVIDQSQKSSKKLQSSILYLNIVLTTATIIGAIATAFLAYHEIMGIK